MFRPGEATGEPKPVNIGPAPIPAQGNGHGGVFGALKKTLGLGGQTHHEGASCEVLGVDERWNLAQQETERAKRAGQTYQELNCAATDYAQEAALRKQEADEARAERASATRQLAELEKRIGVTGQQVDAAARELNEARLKLEEATRLADKTREEREAAEAVQHEREEAAQKLISEANSKEAAARELETKVGNAQRDAEEALAIAKQTEKRVEQFKSATDERKHQVTTLQGEVNALDKRIADTEALLHQLKKDAEDKRHALKDAERTLHDAEKKIPGVEKEVEHKIKDTTQAKQEVAHLTDELATTKAAAREALLKAGPLDADAKKRAADVAALRRTERAAQAEMKRLTGLAEQKIAEYTRGLELKKAAEAKVSELKGDAAAQAKTIAEKEREAAHLASQWKEAKTEAYDAKREEDLHWEKAKKLGDAADEGRRCQADEAEKVAQELLNQAGQTRAGQSGIEGVKAARVTHLEGGHITTDKVVSVTSRPGEGKALSGSQVKEAVSKAVKSEK